ncbi:unnamed protein product [Cuscuta campestris]|uniref:Uncharacterized protein n=1 Tax=Cuscuta campestris TaxID=132261 RepID=A0A484LAQ4_9ASTE|nr:unnamed protein product [Cuscuta campestris]
MAPVDPATWTHESSIIKEDELREVAELLGRGFRVHHPNAAGGVSSPERSKTPPVVESNPAGSSSGSQAQGNTTALAVCKPPAALDVIPISAILGLRKPTPSRKRPREGVTGDDFLPKNNKSEGTPASLSPLTTSSGTQSTAPAAASGGLELPNPDSLDREGDELLDQSALKRPAVQPQPEVINTSPLSATISQGVEGEADRQKEPETSPAREKKASHWTIQGNLEKMRESVQEPAFPQARPDLLALNALHFMEQAQQSLLTLTEQYLGGASGNYRAVVVLKEKELAVRALQQKVDTLEQQFQVLQEENARLKANGSMELAAERSRVKSLQEQISIYQRGTLDLETQFDRLQAQISILESKVSASEDKVGSLKTELVERESRIFKLENSLHDAKQESAHLNDLVIKHIEAKRLILGKLEKERQTASELRSRMDELEKTIAAHQGEVAALTTRAEALYKEGKFGRRITFISPNWHQGVLFRVPAPLLTVPERKFLLAILARPVRRRDAIPTQELPGWSLARGLPPKSEVVSDDDFFASPAQSNDVAGLSPGEFSRLYPALRLPAPSPPSPPRLPSERIGWDSMTLQDFALYQRMRRAKLGRSLPSAEAEPSRESRTASPNLLKSLNDGSSLGAPAPRPGTWENYDIEEAADSAACPSSQGRSPWKGPPPPSC